jgi:hypothetical protein
MPGRLKYRFTNNNIEHERHEEPGRNIMTFKKLIDSVLILILLSSLSSSVAQEASDYAKVETKEQHDQRMAWWREAKFGMFIHWGLYAIPAGEWNGKIYGGISEWIRYVHSLGALRYSGR